MQVKRIGISVNYFDSLTKIRNIHVLQPILRMLNTDQPKEEINGDKFDFADADNDFELISNSVLNDEKYKSCLHVSHGMFYSKTNAVVLNSYNYRALILMQFRFDGYIGFPGGLVEPGEDTTTALNRELSEEMGLTSLVKFEANDKAFIHYNSRKSLILHFYMKEVSKETFEDIELKSAKAPEFGNEVLGVLRVPLYTMSDGFRGFPAFLANKFIGNSKNQLIGCLKMLNLMSSSEIDKALSARPLYLQ